MVTNWKENLYKEEKKETSALVLQNKMERDLQIKIFFSMWTNCYNVENTSIVIFFHVSWCFCSHGKVFQFKLFIATFSEMATLKCA